MNSADSVQQKKQQQQRRDFVYGVCVLHHIRAAASNPYIYSIQGRYKKPVETIAVKAALTPANVVAMGHITFA